MKESPDSTNVPIRYRQPWERPTDKIWVEKLELCKTLAGKGGLVLLIGDRGTGKTRLAAEVIRDRISWIPMHDQYATAMEIFLRIRDAYAKKGADTEGSIVAALSRCPLLVIDEIQERSNSEWEDRIITHIIDRRYGANLPTVIIGNLTAASMERSLGESVVSRASETGGVILMEGKSHRQKP